MDKAGSATFDFTVKPPTLTLTFFNDVTTKQVFKYETDALKIKGLIGSDQKATGVWVGVADNAMVFELEEF